MRRDTTREATAPEVQAQRDENGRLNQALPKIVLENRLRKNVWSTPAMRSRSARRGKRLCKLFGFKPFDSTELITRVGKPAELTRSS